MFSSIWLIILIAAVHTFKRTKNFILVLIGCYVIATGWKFKKGLELGPSHNNHLKKAGNARRKLY